MSYGAGFKAFVEEHITVSLYVPVLFFAVWAANPSHQAAAKNPKHKGTVFKHKTRTEASQSSSLLRVTLPEVPRSPRPRLSLHRGSRTF